MSSFQDARQPAVADRAPVSLTMIAGASVAVALALLVILSIASGNPLAAQGEQPGIMLFGP